MTTAILTLLLNTGFAATDQSCEQIKTACEARGFAKNKAGADLWKECIEPLVQGTPQPKTAKTKLPTLPKQTIADCRAKHGMS